MRTITALLFATLLGHAAAAGAGTAIVGSIAPQEAKTIVSIADRVDALWNDRRAAEIAALYTDDASLEMVGRARGAQGRQGILAYFAESFASLDPAMRHRTDIDRLTVLSPDIVVADGHAWLEKASEDGATTPVRYFNTTTVVVRGDDGWRIRMVRTHLATVEEGLAAAQQRVAGN